jgi:hypothetical protein
MGKISTLVHNRKIEVRKTELADAKLHDWLVENNIFPNGR